MSKCRKCSKTKTEEEFKFSSWRKKDGTRNRLSICLTCFNVAARVKAANYYRANQQKCVAASVRVNMRKWYGITPEQMQEIISAQGGLCPILGECGDDFVVDHDHACPGTFRGVISRKANTALGMLGDDPEALDRAAAYLRRVNKRGKRRQPSEGSPA